MARRTESRDFALNLPEIQWDRNQGPDRSQGCKFRVSFDDNAIFSHKKHEKAGWLIAHRTLP
jgi:hypothetical protein